MIKPFSYRLGNLEARVADRSLLSPRDGYPITVDIVCWADGDKNNWSIAHFDTTGDTPDLTFVGDRPLRDNINWQDFRHLIEISLAYLASIASQDITE